MARSAAERLIAAIHTTEPQVLREVVDELLEKFQREREKAPLEAWFFRNPLDATFGNLELTALHVAAKAYAVHSSNPHLAQVFNEMVQILLDGGANPAMEIGVKRDWRFVMGKHQWCEVEKGQTVAEVCGRNLPPALAGWFAKAVEETRGHTGFLHSRETREAVSQAVARTWERRRARERRQAAIA